MKLQCVFFSALESAVFYHTGVVCSAIKSCDMISSSSSITHLKYHRFMAGLLNDISVSCFIWSWLWILLFAMYKPDSSEIYIENVLQFETMVQYEWAIYFFTSGLICFSTYPHLQ